MSQVSTAESSTSRMEEVMTKDDQIWQALPNCQITMKMNKLLNFIRRFRQTMEARMWKTNLLIIPVNFTESATGTTMVNHHNPTIKVILQGEEIPGCIIDGGSGVNVISKAICNRMGLTDWEACPFWLRIVDTKSIRPLGLLRKLKIVIGEHTFEISDVVLALDAPGAYPLLLGAHGRTQRTSSKIGSTTTSTFIEVKQRFRCQCRKVHHRQKP